MDVPDTNTAPERAPAPPVPLTPPVQLLVRCTACDFERSLLAMHPAAVTGAQRCERCGEPNRILGYRAMTQSGCLCCSTG